MLGANLPAICPCGKVLSKQVWIDEGRCEDCAAESWWRHHAPGAMTLAGCVPKLKTRRLPQDTDDDDGSGFERAVDERAAQVERATRRYPSRKEQLRGFSA